MKLDMYERIGHFLDSFDIRTPALLRRDLFLAADHFRRHDPHGARLYHDLMVHGGKHHNSALCIIANRSLIPRILVVLREQRLYELQNLEGNSITKTEARELAEQWKVTEEVRKRLSASAIKCW